MIEKLTDWFLRNRRDLPFRNSKNPYHILVSETMAQQTRMAALVPYYNRFVETFPDIQALAGAEEADVLSLWAGLGYYARARALHRAAKTVCGDFGGTMPDSAEGLRRLPGVGAYTAGAVASIAFGQPVPAVDGNVRRIHSRFFTQDDGDVEGWVRALMEDAPPGLVTESLMELGALVCTPSAPKCAECPISECCRAFLTGRAPEFPARREKPPKREEFRTVCIVHDGHGRVLLRRRTERLLHHMWEFPTEEWLCEDGFAVERGPAPLGEAAHVFTHLIWRMTAWPARVTYDTLPDNYQWAADLQGYALPSAMRAFTRLIFVEE